MTINRFGRYILKGMRDHFLLIKDIDYSRMTVTCDVYEPNSLRAFLKPKPAKSEYRVPPETMMDWLVDEFGFKVGMDVYQGYKEAYEKEHYTVHLETTKIRPITKTKEMTFNGFDIFKMSTIEIKEEAENEI